MAGSGKAAPSLVKAIRVGWWPAVELAGCAGVTDAVCVGVGSVVFGSAFGVGFETETVAGVAIGAGSDEGWEGAAEDAGAEASSGSAAGSRMAAAGVAGFFVAMIGVAGAGFAPRVSGSEAGTGEVEVAAAVFGFAVVNGVGGGMAISMGSGGGGGKSDTDMVVGALGALAGAGALGALAATVVISAAGAAFALSAMGLSSAGAGALRVLVALALLAVR